MKVEIVSIGTELLVSDILDTNAAYISRSMREVQATLTCKVTVGDDPEMILDALRVGLNRADIVLTTGGLGSGPDDYTKEAVAKLTGRKLTTFPPGVDGAILLGNHDERLNGFRLDSDSGTIICLPGNRREMAYILETDVFPYIRKRIPVQLKSGWILLRTIGVMESSLKQELSTLQTGPNHRITFDSFAGQTNIRIWAEAATDNQVKQELDRLKLILLSRLGDHVFGFEEDRLEDVVLATLKASGRRLAIAECYTDQVLADTFLNVPDGDSRVIVLPTTNWRDLADYLQLEQLALDNLTYWCRTAAEQLLVKSEADLGLVVYNNVTQGGIQTLVTLASPFGVSVTQRSFGGHPENIGQWAFTLGLTHLRRWLMVHH
jgi:nicotinamide-nucleotide amidase